MSSWLAYWPSWLPYPYNSLDVTGSMVWFAIWFVFLSVVDLILRFGVGIPRNHKSHWFALHSIANAFVVLLVLPDMYYTFSDPAFSISPYSCHAGAHSSAVLASSAGSSSLTYASAIASLSRSTLRFLACNEIAVANIAATHMYHVFMYRDLPWDDIFHHVVFCGTIIPLRFVSSFGTWGNTLCFFISGLPGGIDYGLLALVKLGRLAPIKEKQINASLNMWCRGPGLISVVVVLYIAYLYSPAHNVSAAAVCIGGLLVVFNGQYYAGRVVGSLHVHRHLQAQRAKQKAVEAATSSPTAAGPSAAPAGSTGKERPSEFPTVRRRRTADSGTMTTKVETTPALTGEDQESAGEPKTIIRRIMDVFSSGDLRNVDVDRLSWRPS
eukprot:TRINITY_DN10698_c0_g1_i1.p1 TRINITY_DN10698_c0_g1~~TRINITY_DN10698_c0_g1_i1.p1  ORF type:complete len:382 (+),score=44.97 TRINITY_DN10698_c0_g1_i1:51-1196(+)